MRCYKIDEKIILEIDKPLLSGDRVEIVLRVEDPTALEPMEQEPEIVRGQEDKWQVAKTRPNSRFRKPKKKKGTSRWY